MTNIDQFKEYAGIKSTENDDRINTILTSVIALIKTYCGRTFVDYYDNNYEEVFDGGTQHYYLREFPIRSISSVSTSSDYGKSYTVLPATDYVVDKRRDTLFIITGNFYEGINAIKVIYKGGYEDVPQDLKLAIFDLVLYYMKQETPAKKTMGFLSIEHITTADFPSHIKRVLDLYRVL